VSTSSQEAQQAQHRVCQDEWSKLQDQHAKDENTINDLLARLCEAECRNQCTQTEYDRDVEGESGLSAASITSRAFQSVFVNEVTTETCYTFPQYLDLNDCESAHACAPLAIHPCMHEHKHTRGGSHCQSKSSGFVQFLE